MPESVRGYLLDANVIIALVVAEHEHHDAAVAWFAGVERAALCPVVEGALMRFLLRIGENARTAEAMLRDVHAHPRIGYVADSISYLDAGCSDLRGHRQLTDAYLAALAGAENLTLATFDTALHALRPERTELLG